MPAQDPSSLAAHHRTQLILWLAITLAPVLYLQIILFTPVERDANSPPIEIPLLIAGIGLVAASFVLPKRLFPQPESGRDLAKERSALVIALAMCEAPAIFGVIVHFAMGSPWYWLFLAIGFAGLLLHRPKRDTESHAP